MGTAYDTYDYTSYWEDRQYEHESEVVCLKSFLAKIPKIEKVIEIGAGFGRLVPYYSFRAKKVVLSEPSAKLLAQARNELSDYQNVEFVQSKIENLGDKFRKQSFDLALMVRVMHHLTDIDKAFETIEGLLSGGGYFILEFANKIHAKSTLSHLTKGDMKFYSNEESVDVRSQESIKRKTLPFFNYHPNLVKKTLEKHNFEIIETRSVSNIRSPFLKKYLPITLLLWLEKYLQLPLSYLNFGPSIFILARKRG